MVLLLKLRGRAEEDEVVRDDLFDALGWPRVLVKLQLRIGQDGGVLIMADFLEKDTDLAIEVVELLLSEC